MIKIVHIATLVLLALVGLGTIGTQLAHATNESSYKFGYDMGFGIYQLGVTNHGENGPPDSNDIDRCYTAVVPDVHNTNSTACMDGYIDGWAHWCSEDPKGCVVSDAPNQHYQPLPNQRPS